MKDIRIMRTLVFLVIVFSVVIGAFACKKQEGKVEKTPTAIDKPLPSDAFKADISVKNLPSSMKVSSVSTLAVNVKNISNVLWPAKGQPDGAYSIRLAYHWLDKDGKVVIWDGIRTPLPHDVKPGAEITLNATIKSADKPGDYILEFDMVQERVAWFKAKGSKTAKIDVKVD